MTNIILAWLLGAREFRSDLTSHQSEERAAIAYDWGREIMHRLTLRRWDR